MDGWNKKMILRQLNDAYKGIPVNWDRCYGTMTEFVVFGWIKRNDGERDFVCHLFLAPMDEESRLTITSSAKYTQQISENMGSIHCECQKFNTYFFDLLDLVECPECKQQVKEYRLTTVIGKGRMCYYCYVKQIPK